MSEQNAANATGVTTATATAATATVSAAAKKPHAKARHRWSKEVSTVEFHLDNFESTATVLWRKRNEMIIKKGAKLRREAPLNKDGSVGLDDRWGNMLRQEHADAIKDFETIDDIVLKSVNETGLFLYFGRANGWLQFFDKDGKSINDWTVVQ
ncbi:hypothetical protein [Bifidobacterium tibiigranuli]|jgi:hypothetical protein|uniref:hypothetical protein n=1 Tax=Bifidobacterium tibiigranuli TaxID=2172043 RepID=UPI0026F02C15|nr:hypothetical protein [Bifidobacterium tibiigranuli]MCI1649506.1 hypothetical protein [Bifidobacterium tibiigranuli]MCI2185034.1 hypothetical protein [Bifidobacterium tibiigranuli]MCI2203401.1 hypothetical protein [Bifidobacterium tibiigranuli]